MAWKNLLLLSVAGSLRNRAHTTRPTTPKNPSHQRNARSESNTKRNRKFQDSWNQSKSYQLFGSVEWSARSRRPFHIEGNQREVVCRSKFMRNLVSADSHFFFFAPLLIRINSGINDEYERIWYKRFSTDPVSSACSRIKCPFVRNSNVDRFVHFSRKQFLFAFINWKNTLDSESYIVWDVASEMTLYECFLINVNLPCECVSLWMCAE